MAKTTKFKLPEAADRLADLKAQEKDIADEITALKARILTEIGSLEGEHTTIVGKTSLWDIKQAETKTVSWKAVAEAMNAPADLIGVHTVTRQQVYFCQKPTGAIKS